MSSLLPLNSNSYYISEALIFAKNKSLIERLLGLFVDALEKQMPLNISKSSIGYNQTFLSNIEIRENNYPTLFPKNLAFILKIDNANYVKNEKFAAYVLRLLGFTTPFIVSIKENKRNGAEVINILQQNLPDLYYVKKTDRLFFMLTFKGENLNEMLNKTGSFYKLSEENLRFLFLQLGRLALFDLLLGNNDRLFRLQYNSATIFGDPFFNTGNVMVLNEDNKFKIFTIDNGATSELEYRGNTLPLYHKFNNVFKYVISNQTEFAKHLLSSLKTRIKKLFSDDDMIKLLETGIISGFDLLKNLDREDFLRNLDNRLRKSLQSKNESSLRRITFELIKANLLEISKIKNFF